MKLTKAIRMSYKFHKVVDVGRGKGKLTPSQSKVVIDRLMEDWAQGVSDRVAKQVSMAVEMLYRWIRARDEGWFLLNWSCGGHSCLRYAGVVD